ncbi:metal-dependent transcriptional regulator [Pseudonocardia asaccharolytica]|uniref:Manganese transport regulator n=1 Tax=Pseudonocardia asaccharolytica DSM 44247 = NBRC 16224 TaxID=1123024 RepID=A0A511CXL5_9PSEU|nr:metal-dependent transcriptional regulator [Pseudonocardia asaccharolytica]GEL17301.1 transcriptional regulator [Pseudonocardia asaccharolytica DSM 44247 = NBRC 16224]
MPELSTRGAAERRHPSCCDLTHTDAVEDTLKTIFVLAGRGSPVSTSALAYELAVTPPTASSMLKRLEAHGLVHRTEDHLAALTAHGARHAQQMVRRHRLLEAFLAQVLHVPWDEVHAEAEVLEHAVSDRLLARIDELLGHPTLDPHGDPIPSLGGNHVESWGQRLDQVRPGTRFRVERVYDRDSAALRYLADLGVQPGVTVEMHEHEPFGGPLWLSIGGRRQALSDRLAALVHGREER